MSSIPLVDFYSNSQLSGMPMRALVPTMEILKPGGIVFTDENFHLLPFGCNLIPFDMSSKSSSGMLTLELELLKKETGLLAAKVPLQLAAKGRTATILGLCAVCGEKAQSTCQSCMSVTYCSREHQIAHWKDHRPFCVLYEVAQNPIEGCHIVAKTNIKKGEVVLIEEPYFVSPYSADEHFQMLNFETVSEENRNMEVGNYTVEEYEANVCKFPLVCVGCSTYLEHDNGAMCKCGWRICEQDCQELQRHQDLECSYFVENNIVFNECRKVAIMTPRIIGIVRALLLKRRAFKDKEWNDTLFDIRSRNIWSSRIIKNLSSRANVEYLLVILRSVFKFEDLQFSELCTIMAVIELKGVYGCVFEPINERVRRVVNVYRTASMIQHRCLGNVFTICTSSGSIHVIATRTIKKGEVLYRNYDTIGDLSHILHRQVLTFARTNKPCDCALCVDVTKIENSLSAIVCLKCKRRNVESYMVVETPSESALSWKCQKCNAKKSNEQMCSMLKGISKELEIQIQDCEDVCEFEEKLISCIAKFKGRVVHQEHAIVLAAECDLMYHMFDRLSTLCPEEASFLTELLNTRVRNLQKILPEAHSSVVSMKMRLALVMFHQAQLMSYRQGEVFKIFEDLQLIYNDVTASFVENTKPNVLQAYILNCLRKMRILLSEVSKIFDRAHKFPKSIQSISEGVRKVHISDENSKQNL